MSADLTVPDRDTIFICHASPDDDDFVRWLGTRLTGHGFKVWADLFKLKGGAPFWSTIEEALRHHACKVIFVASRKSVAPDRTGVLNEISVADSIKKQIKDNGFIIPVKIDDTPFSEFPIQIHRLNAIDFARGWGPKLVELLDTLENANVFRSVGDQTVEFEKWRSTMVRTSAIVEVAEEKVLTNLLCVLSMPTTVTFFEYEGDNTKIAALMKETGIPHALFNRHIISFAQMSTIQERLPPSFSVMVRAHVSFDDFTNGSTKEVSGPVRENAQKIATSLLRQHVENYFQSRGLRKFETSSAPAFYFPSGLLPKDKVSYVAASGRKTNKNVVGRSERNQVNWHLAMKVNVVLGPPAVVRFKPYVCFSEDAQAAIDDPKKTSAIRRRFCRNWWNGHWRQLQEAFCTFLADGNEAIEINLDGPEKYILASHLLELTAARRMPDDLKFAEDPEDPVEPDDSEPDDRDDYNGPDLEDAT